jgi:hypothetical protein
MHGLGHSLPPSLCDCARNGVAKWSLELIPSHFVLELISSHVARKKSIPGKK